MPDPGSALRIRPNYCTCCGLCELACSFHHSHEFGRHRSSVVVVKDHRRGDAMIRIRREPEDVGPACDGCSGHAVPLCVHWCPTSAITARRPGHE